MSLSRRCTSSSCMPCPVMQVAHCNRISWHARLSSCPTSQMQQGAPALQHLRAGRAPLQRRIMAGPSRSGLHGANSSQVRLELDNLKIMQRIVPTAIPLSLNETLHAVTGKLLVLAASPSTPAGALTERQQQQQGGNTATLVKCIDLSALPGGGQHPTVQVTSVRACCHPEAQQAALFVTYQGRSGSSLPGSGGDASTGVRCWCSALVVAVQDCSLQLVRRVLLMHDKRMQGIGTGRLL